ncbi:MAG TPA: hemerythrin family protein, partial [Geobacteraceae bacterium]
KLFNLFNRMCEECLHSENDNCKDTIIDELVSYADYHFEAEERYMAGIGYRDIDNHIEMHRYFTRKTFEMRQVSNNNTKELIDFLGNWLSQHVMEEDRKIFMGLSPQKESKAIPA